MARRARWAAALATVALAAFGAAQAGGCFQASGLGDITFAQPDAGKGGEGTGGMPSQDGGTKCASAAECDDQSPCTDDACTSGRCEHTPKPDGLACDLGGTAGTCREGACSISCKTSAECQSANPCQTGTCNGATSLCEYTNVADGTPPPGVTQVAGDCKQHLCLMGTDTDAPDDADIPMVPTSMAGCADAKCDKGTPSFPLHAAGSPCSTWMGDKPGFCSAAGACAQCSQDSDCGGAGTDCEHPACVSDACVQVLASNGTPTVSNPPQIPGDCQTIVCDGNGGTTTTADATDVPNDPTGCNPGVCNGTTPAHMEAPNGTACLGGCGSATLSCESGKCTGCNMSCQCQLGGKEPNATCQPLSLPPACLCTPSTCSQLGLTCGTGSDGCGGTLLCNDGKVDGSETDVDCGGATTKCGARCAQGKHCTATSDCASGLTCADGVCCNAACAGACEACSAAKKGQGADGVCGAVAAGQADPHGVCMSQPLSTCGQMGGTCDGSGACSTWPSGAVCAPGTCMGSVLNKPSACAGGACQAPAPKTQDCAPYACAASGCKTTCASDSDCASGDYCKGSMCVPQLPQGAACTAADQCTSGFCASGVCCDKACSGQCQACSAALTGGTDGTCGDVVAGMPDPSGSCPKEPSTTCETDGNCAAGATCEMVASGTSCGTNCQGGMLDARTCDGNGLCNGTPTLCPGNYACLGTACATSCAAGQNECANGFFCNAGMCVSNNSGATCENNTDCWSNTCVGGFCCVSSTCKQGGGGQCGATQCAPGTGACTPAPALTPCGQLECQGLHQVHDNICDGMGNCQIASYQCTVGQCQAGVCNPCQTDNDCSQWGWCSGSTCLPKGQSGATCAAANGCLSGTCSSGMCQ